MAKKVSLLLVFCLGLLINLTGCYDAAEVDDEVYALVLGIDKGINNKVRVTIQYPTYKSSGGGGGESKSGGRMEAKNETQGSIIDTIEAPSILEALDMYGMSTSRRVSLMHMKNIIISEELAKEGVQAYVSPLARYREARGVVNISVARGTAQKFIQENKSNIGESLAKDLELMTVQSDNTSFFPRVTFYDFYNSLLSTYEQGYTAYAGLNELGNLPEDKYAGKAPLMVDNAFKPGEIPRSGVAKREYAGTAVFRDGKMVGSLNSEETRYFMMIVGKFTKGIIDMEDRESPGKVISLNFRPSRKPVVRAYFKKGRPIISIKLEMEADIGAVQSRVNYEDKDQVKKLSTRAEDYLERRAVQVIGKVQQQYNSDIFGFGQKLAGYFPTIQEWEKYDWLSHFKEAGINVKVNVSIRRTGLMLKSARITGYEK
ncbi:spore germination protein B3 precursor [Ruminiclostridium hungatei]|uniref:Spore germination protein B3 n=1 Tax=Ruminiclostridium hungatei TaxID=48256 RepID=A0A1V4SPX9_RUMHU|nr:Ger(x)C family spore germination protein [Ruminiclostridium hungatei]OPX45910.1 spore germination protein B3 precursor [Ruminiclostridium hungatei]